jgi:hypothetical protein
MRSSNAVTTRGSSNGAVAAAGGCAGDAPVVELVEIAFDSGLLGWGPDDEDTARSSRREVAASSLHVQAC